MNSSETWGECKKYLHGSKIVICFAASMRTKNIFVMWCTEKNCGGVVITINADGGARDNFHDIV